MLDRAPHHIERESSYIEEEHAILLAFKREEVIENMWYLDTGVNNHMCGKRNMFVELEESTNGQILFSDSLKIPVKGKGKVLTRQKDQSRQLISNVYYAPDMKNNLISLGQLLDKGYIIHLEDRCLCIKEQKKRLIVKVQMTKNQMFLLNIQVGNVMCLNANIKDPS